jgi:hypothetical protein
MAWQGNGMGAAWEQYGMCELAFIQCVRKVAVHLDYGTRSITIIAQVGVRERYRACNSA